MLVEKCVLPAHFWIPEESKTKILLRAKKRNAQSHFVSIDQVAHDENRTIKKCHAGAILVSATNKIVNTIVSGCESESASGSASERE